MQRVYAFFALAAVAVLSIAGWAWLGRPIDMPPVPGGRLQCLSYAPTHDGGSPLDGADYTVPDGMIERDLDALKAVTSCLRTYSSYGVQGEVLPLAAKKGFKLLLGIWIGADDELNAKEIDAALAVAEKYPQAVRAIVVGNEVLLRREMTGERLADIIAGVKARTSLPVTYADIYEFWRRNPVVGEAVDIITIHVLPYWDDPTPVSIDQVQAHVRTIVDTARATLAQKPLQIGEIGWPSAGRTRGLAVPSLVNEARFVREFATQAESLGLPYNVIEAIDQPWKRAPEGTVGGFWGIIDRDRQEKFPLTGPVSEWPHWPLAAAFTVAVATLATGWGLTRRRKPGPLCRFALAAAGAVCGAALWALWFQVTALAIGILGDIWAVYLIVIAASGGVLATLLLADPDSRFAVAPASLPSVVRWLRRPTADAPHLLGLWQWLVLFPAGVLALSMAVDGRHRDFLTLAYLMPAVAMIILAWQSRDSAREDRPEAAWLAGLLLVSGPLAVDAWSNREAWAWAGVCLLLALPWLPRLGPELRRLGRCLGPRREA
jgi:exo-beta-1,3-glucanase (GH17 family)